MRVFIPRECADGETRVAATPETVKQMAAAGLAPIVERGAGQASHFIDSAYERAGATLSDDAKAEWQRADIVLKVAAPMRNQALDADEATLLKEGVKTGWVKPSPSTPPISTRNPQVSLSIMSKPS